MTMKRFLEFWKAQFRPMHETERVNYSIGKWLAHPVRTWRLWHAHHNPALARAIRERWEKMASDIESGRMIFRAPDESDAEFRARVLKQ